MKRRIYTDDHEAFRASAREFVDREVRPRMEEFIEARAIPRDIWIEAGKQGLLGLEIPEEYGGSEAGDYRFNAVLGEEFARVSAVGVLVPGHPRRRRRALPARPVHRGAEAALAARASAPASSSRRSR